MKIGILGGTFDPLHSEHMEIVRSAYVTLGLDKVILLPTYNPPHKHCHISAYEDRVNMLKIFASKTPYAAVDEAERELNLDNAYSYIVLSELKRRYSDDELYYLIGSDSLMKFATWMKPEVVASLVKIRVTPRGNVREEASKEAERLNSLYVGSDIALTDFDCKEISSSLLKLYFELGEYDKAREYVDSDVVDYISERRLYSNYGDIVKRLRSEMTEKLYNHVVRTAEFAVKHAWQVGVDFDSAFLTAMLHDARKQFPPLHPVESYPTYSREVIHQYDGAEAAPDYGVKDAAILDAIRYHTTAKPGMSALGKLIYCADKLEDGRSYEGVDKLRSLADSDFEGCFRALLAHNYEYVRKNASKVDDLTYEAYKCYNTDDNPSEVKDGIQTIK